MSDPYVAGARAALAGRPLAFRPLAADLHRQEELADLLARAQPAGVLLCATTQSPWEALTAPSAWTDLLARAGFGLALPLHAQLALVTGRAVAAACPGAWFINACFPDAVNPLLAACGVPVLCGIGNVALLAVQREAARPELNQVTGHAGALLLRDLLAGTEVAASLPGPLGLPGGYPVRLAGGRLALWLPPGVSEAAALAFNQRAALRDGVVVDGRRVEFAPSGGSCASLRRRSQPASPWPRWWQSPTSSTGCGAGCGPVTSDRSGSNGRSANDDTGEAVMIFSPTWANKSVALRDAVLRAITAGLVSPEQLRVATPAPRSCRHKLRASRLSDDPHLRALNPQLEYAGDQPEAVKALGRAFVDRHAPALRRGRGVNLWYSLELRNYLIADTARAFFEQRVDPIEEAGRPRLHAHAVSGAFGLLGYHQGRSALERAGLASPEHRPASLLVQHLAAPDMVLNLAHGDFDRSRAPAYALDPTSGLYRQEADRRFPRVTYDPDEVLDPTLYTHRPATSPAMNELIQRFGGDGIVVSLAECVERYPYLRGWLEEGPRPLPADFRTLREWSLVMALTGALNAIDRGMIEAGRDVVVHGSGSYAAADYVPLEAAALTPVLTVDDVAAALLG